MSDVAERLRMMQAGALAGNSDLSLSMPGQSSPRPVSEPNYSSNKTASVKIPGEFETRPLLTEQDRIQALNKLGEALRAPTPSGALHEFCLAVSIIAGESVHDTSIEARKALRGAVANLYGFSERIR